MLIFYIIIVGPEILLTPHRQNVSFFRYGPSCCFPKEVPCAGKLKKITGTLNLNPT